MYTLINVGKEYKKANQNIVALSDVNINIPAGQFVAVQGRTGGGKSTLLQMLGALDRPTTGTVLLGDDNLSQASNGRLGKIRGKHIGIVFQTFNLIPTLNALDNVIVGLVPLEMDAVQRRERSEAALEAVGLGERMHHLPAELSGGQQQRVAIARALVKEPEVLLADEPTGNLDEDTRGEIVTLLETMWREKGITLVVVTHDTWVAHRAERRLRLSKGKLSEATQ